MALSALEKNRLLELNMHIYLLVQLEQTFPVGKKYIEMYLLFIYFIKNE